MIARKIYRLIVFLMLLSFLSITAISIFANSNSPFSSDYTDDNRFKSYDHELNQGYINDPQNGRSLFYWIQVSDIHIQMTEGDLQNREKFETFCSDTIPTISPAFVLSSGDNVNGEFREDSLPEQQYQSEAQYQFFNETLIKNGLGPSFYYSGMGNHESYNWESETTLFQTYMRKTPEYYFDVDSPCGTYRFVCLDTTQSLGVGNPFNYWGEMKSDRLNALEDLLDDTPEDVNEIVFWGHHPINQVYSEKSKNGKTFKELISGTDSSLYMCGHLHIENLYWNHGEFTELQCPAFKDEAHYRLLAIDNGYYSFSEQISEEWPAVIITNPISDLLYTEGTDFTNINEASELRVLIFDPNPILEASVILNGQKIGDLTDQGNNLWTLSYDPANFKDGANDLRVEIRSDSGQASDEISFNTKSFKAIQTSGFLKYIIAVDIRLGLSILIVIFLIGLYSTSFLPKLYYYSNDERRSKLLEIDAESLKEEGFVKRHVYKNWIQAARLPLSSWILLALTPLYIFVGPILIAPLINDIWGSLWLYGIFVSGSYTLDLYSLIFPFAFLILFGIVQNFVIRSNQSNPSKLRYIPIMLYFLIMIVVIYFFSGYFPFVSVILSPFVLILLIVPIFLIWNSVRI